MFGGARENYPMSETAGHIWSCPSDITQCLIKRMGLHRGSATISLLGFSQLDSPVVQQWDSTTVGLVYAGFKTAFHSEDLNITLSRGKFLKERQEFTGQMHYMTVLKGN